MTFVIPCRNIRRFPVGLDNRLIINTQRTSVHYRQQRSLSRPILSCRVQENSVDLLLRYWSPISSNRRFSWRLNFSSKKENPSAAKLDNNLDRNFDSMSDQEDCITDSGINSNVSPAALIAAPQSVQETDQTRDFVVLMTTLLIGVLLLSILTLVFVANLGLKLSIVKVCRKLFKSIVARQMFTIIGTMIFVRSGLTPVVKSVREFLDVKTPWEKSTENYLLKELYSPLELLLGAAALGALAESILPNLISVSKSTIAGVVHSIVSLMFVFAAAKVVSNMKSRILRETKWKLEIEGKTTEQHRIEAVDKLLTIAILIVTSILSLQSMGLDVNSVLAIGGVGGLAIGLAGREIFENFFSGLLIMGSRPFDVGDEIRCLPASGSSEVIEGMAVEVGWYRTVVRNWERELYVIPNSLFTRSVVLNISRKGKEWRFFEFLPVRLKDLDKVETAMADMRRIMRQDPRVIQKLHKRAFLNDINTEFVNIYVSFYLEVPNRDAFMAARQQLYLAFVDCIWRNGAEIAEKKLVVEHRNETANQSAPNLPIATMNEVVRSDSISSREVREEYHNGGSLQSNSSHLDIPREVRTFPSLEAKLDD